MGVVGIIWQLSNGELQNVHVICERHGICGGVCYDGASCYNTILHVKLNRYGEIGCNIRTAYYIINIMRQL